MRSRAFVAGWTFAGLALLAAATTSVGAQSVRGLDSKAAPALSADAIRVVQRALRDRAMNPGPLDGIVGPKTAEAIRQFQEHFGMPPSGTIDNQLLLSLGHADLAVGSNP